jgi:hypothetical protein
MSTHNVTYCKEMRELAFLVSALSVTFTCDNVREIVKIIVA